MQTWDTHKPVRPATEVDDYSRLGLESGEIDPREDGLHLDPAQPNIEWWYFDSILDDGAKPAVIFMTKDGSRSHQPLEPAIEIDLDLPDGRRFMKSGRFRVEEFSASDSGCDVRIGPYRFVGDPHEYDLRFAGPARLDRFEAGELVEQHEGTGSFEQCYFGHKLHGDT